MVISNNRNDVNEYGPFGGFGRGSGYSNKITPFLLHRFYALRYASPNLIDRLRPMDAIDNAFNSMHQRLAKREINDKESDDEIEGSGDTIPK